jgi:hypothetical protein
MRATVPGRLLVQYPTKALCRDILVYVREERKYRVVLTSSFGMVVVYVYSDVWRKMSSTVVYGVNEPLTEGRPTNNYITANPETDALIDEYLIDNGYTRIDHKFTSYVPSDRDALSSILSSVQESSIECSLLCLYAVLIDLVCVDVAAEVVLTTSRVLRVQLDELSRLFSFPVSRR